MNEMVHMNELLQKENTILKGTYANNDAQSYETI